MLLVPEIPIWMSYTCAVGTLGRQQCRSYCHVCVETNLLHCGAVPVCLMSRNLGESDRILNLVMALGEKDVMLGETWMYGYPSL